MKYFKELKIAESRTFLVEGWESEQASGFMLHSYHPLHVRYSPPEVSFFRSQSLKTIDPPKLLKREI